MNGFQQVWSVRHGLAPLLDLRAWGGGLGVAGAAFLLGLGILPRLRLRRFADRQLARLLAGLVLLAPLTLLIGQLPGALAHAPAWLAFSLSGWLIFFYLLFRARARNRIFLGPRTASSAIRNPQSAIGRADEAVRAPRKSAIRNPQSPCWVASSFSFPSPGACCRPFAPR